MSTVLLMEPDRLLAASYSAALMQAGHLVIVQPDAQEAIRSLDQEPVDLVILEIQLAGHNGVEFLHEMRSYPEWDQIPVLLHTMVRPDHAGLGRPYWHQLGIAAYLYKPQTSLKQLTDQAQQLMALIQK
jgi:DNA-binding response OmpR family regulator